MAIRYARDSEGPSRASFYVDGRCVATIDGVGYPSDKALPGAGGAGGAGEPLSLDSLQVGHGLFTLLDAFPYQDRERPDLSVSVPLSERAYGQGAKGAWNNIVVSTRRT
jgi:hypothetical protein